MASTKASVTILAAVSVAAGGTKGAPATGGTGSWVAINTGYGGSLGYSILNGASAPGVAGTITIQMSPDNGTTVFDWYSISGDTNIYNSSTLLGLTTGALDLPKGPMYVRAICYGNTTNAVTFALNLQHVTAL
jgi:hypothetical protein